MMGIELWMLEPFYWLGLVGITAAGIWALANIESWAIRFGRREANTPIVETKGTNTIDLTRRRPPLPTEARGQPDVAYVNRELKRKGGDVVPAVGGVQGGAPKG